MGFLGLDVVAIRQLARQLDLQAREVDTAVRELTALLADTVWSGNDQSRFVAEWSSSYAPGLRRSRELLVEAARLALDNAADQERASR